MNYLWRDLAFRGLGTNSIDVVRDFSDNLIARAMLCAARADALEWVRSGFVIRMPQWASPCSAGEEFADIRSAIRQ
jgi:hypothetical protein